MIPYTLIPYSEFARKGKEIADRIELGERFAIIRDRRVFARVEPEPDGTEPVVYLPPIES